MKKSIETKKKLIQTAKEMVIQKGYDCVSIRDISQASKINVAAVSYYFSNKDSLMGEIFLLILQDLKEKLNEKVGGHLNLKSMEEVVESIFDSVELDVKWAVEGWLNRDILVGTVQRVQIGQEVVTGEVRHIDPCHCLVLETENGIRECPASTSTIINT